MAAPSSPRRSPSNSRFIDQRPQSSQHHGEKVPLRPSCSCAPSLLNTPQLPFPVGMESTQLLLGRRHRPGYRPPEQHHSHPLAWLELALNRQSPDARHIGKPASHRRDQPNHHDLEFRSTTQWALVSGLFSVADAQHHQRHPHRQRRPPEQASPASWPRPGPVRQPRLRRLTSGHISPRQPAQGRGRRRPGKVRLSDDALQGAPHQRDPSKLNALVEPAVTL